MRGKKGRIDWQQEEEAWLGVGAPNEKRDRTDAVQRETARLPGQTNQTEGQKEGLKRNRSDEDGDDYNATSGSSAESAKTNRAVFPAPAREEDFGTSFRLFLALSTQTMQKPTRLP